jgi:hypothetical protein
MQHFQRRTGSAPTTPVGFQARKVRRRRVPWDQESVDVDHGRVRREDGGTALDEADHDRSDQLAVVSVVLLGVLPDLEDLEALEGRPAEVDDQVLDRGDVMPEQLTMNDAVHLDIDVVPLEMSSRALP